MKRRITFLYFMLAACIAVMAESINVTVKGKTEKNSKVVSVYINGGNRNSVRLAVTNGDFVYNGTVEKETFLLFYDAVTKKPCWVVADGTDVTLDMTNDKVTGTTLNDRLTSLNDTLRTLKKGEENYRNMAEKESDEAKATLLRSRARVEKRKYAAKVEVALEENKANALPALLLYLQGIYLEHDKFVSYVKGETYYRKHPLMQPILYQTMNDEAKYSIIGKKFIDFTVKDADGASHKLSDYAGKGNYILIDFWASWCKPCMMEMPTLKKAMERYGKNGFGIVGVSLDNDAAQWQGAVKNAALDWIQLSNLVGWDEPGIKPYNVRSIPSNFLCNGDGVVVALDLRGTALLEKLEEIYDVK